jgi:phosphatidate cytidylyltransferase
MTKIASGIVLGAVALACAWAGGWPWVVLVAVVGLALALEWVGLCTGRTTLRPDLSGWVSMAVLAASVAISGWLGVRGGLVLLVVGAAATGVAALATRAANPLWRSFGVVYLGAPCLAIVWLRASPEAGLSVLLWVLALVWATDIAAYVAGKRIGGPKLAPRISPAKTWAGLAGGVAAAAVVGAVAALWLRLGSVHVLVGLSAALAVVEQIGDLIESAIKRRFGVKDSSAIIPGHGGFLDRVDGLMAVAVAVAGLTLAGGGNMLTW